MNPRDKTRNVKILRRAAGEFLKPLSCTGCCKAITDNDNDWISKPLHIFKMVFKEDATEYHRPCYEAYWWERGDKESRILALLLTAELIRTNSLP